MLLRSDELTISGRLYSDASKAITCKYAFTDPTGELSANTVLKFRGKNGRLEVHFSKRWNIADLRKYSFLDLYAPAQV
jgi:hypothetical protein